MKIVNKDLLKEINDLIINFDDITTSDLQGCCDYLAFKFGVDSNFLLNYVYNKNNVLLLFYVFEQNNNLNGGVKK